MVDLPQDELSAEDGLTVSAVPSVVNPLRVPDGVVAAVLALISGIVYVMTLAPGVVAGNSGEYQYTSYILSITHSTGYPLYTLLGKLFTFVPVGSIAYRMNLLSAVAAAIAVALIYLIVRQLIRSQVFSAAAALIFAFGASFWGAALIAEVHTLNAAFVALDIWLLLRWQTTRQRTAGLTVAWKELRWFALAYGLSLTHHRLSLLLAPAFVLFIVLTLAARSRDSMTPAEPRSESSRAGWLEAVLTLLCLLLPLLLYAYIPLRGQYYLGESDPAVTEVYKNRVPEAILRGTVSAHYRQSWEGFINLVTGRDYAVDVGIDSWEQLGERLAVWLTTLIEQFTAVGIVLSAIGVLVLLKRDWRRAAMFILGYSSVTAFAIVYVGHGQIWYYFMPAYVFLVGFMGVAFDAIWGLLENRRHGENSQPVSQKPYRLYAILCFLLPLAMLYNNWHLVAMNDHHIDQNRAEDVLSRDLEQGAVLVGPWDIVSAVRYYQYAEGIRPDLVVIHADPAYSSGQKIIEQCIALHRPLYLLGPSPLDVNLAQATGDWVTVTPLPYLGVPETTEPMAEFGRTIALVTSSVQPNPVYIDPDTGAALHVQVLWEALSAVDRNLKVFIHLISQDAMGIAQVDESPASVYYPTSRWQSGELFRGDYWLVLPSDAPAGPYRLELGLYDDDGERLVVSSDDTDRDTLELGSVDIVRENAKGAQ